MMSKYKEYRTKEQIMHYIPKSKFDTLKAAKAYAEIIKQEARQ